MKISYRWLTRHVDLSGVAPERVVELLTLHTAEVDSLTRFAPALDAVVVGFVAERAPHPDADKLSVCQVEWGTHERTQIVCGAPNVAAGQKVAVAMPGAMLPGDVKIKAAKIRGQESRGMICSERELGIGEEHDGIWVLPADAPLGRPVGEALGLVDWVIEIDNKSLTHRPDLWGHRGIARELAALLERDLLPLAKAPLVPKGDRAIRVELRTPGCRRYMALPVAGVKNGRSPQWMRHLLLAAGQRPIDLLVDLSNFAMLDLGQPNHFFDGAALAGAAISVREARSGESLRTLDGEQRSLAGGDLLICAGERPVALAGIMGGDSSKVTEATRELVLELATFQPTPVRRTSQRLALRSESSARFEKSLDPALVDEAAGLIVHLLTELAPGAHLAGPPAEAGDWRQPEISLALRPDRVRAVLGASISDQRMVDVLTRLGFGVDRSQQDLRVSVPSWRATKDVSIEEDLIEEIGRTVGYASLGEAQLIEPLIPAPRDERRALVRAIENRLALSAGFHQVETYSFLPDALARTLQLSEQPHCLVQNPIAEGWHRVRRSVAPSLLGLLAQNLRQRPTVRLFEVGKGYRPERCNGRGEPLEVHEVALVAVRPRAQGDPSPLEGALAELRGVVEALIEGAGAVPGTWERADRIPGFGPVPYLHPARTALLRGGALAVAGELHPGVARALEVEGDVAVATLDLGALLGEPRPGVRHRPLPRFPGLTLDVALEVPEAVAAGDVVQWVRGAGKGLVEAVELFDLFRGAALQAGSKSLAFHVTLRAPDRTLGEGDGQKFLDRLARAAESSSGRLRREGAPVPPSGPTGDAILP